jgi:hypothetical protein
MSNWAIYPKQTQTNPIQTQLVLRVFVCIILYGLKSCAGGLFNRREQRKIL